MPDYKEVEGYVHSVETLGALDGPGLRFIVFLQGCLLRCKYCHNPDTWVCSGGNKVTAGVMSRNPDTRACSVGTRVTAGEQADDILRYRNYITGGITISGGEPLLQPEFTEALIRECKSRGILHAAIDTSGAVPLEKCRAAVDAADLLLLDIKAFADDVALELTGLGTGNAWEILDYCEETGKAVWIRHVLVPGITVFEHGPDGNPFADEESFRAGNAMLINGAARLKEYRCIRKIELLPFHKMGEFKWDELHIPCPLKDTEEPSEVTVQRSRAIFVW